MHLIQSNNFYFEEITLLSFSKLFHKATVTPEQKSTQLSEFNIDSIDDHLRKSTINLKDAKAEVREEKANFCVIKKDELILVFPRCSNNLTGNLEGPFINIASTILKIISAAGQDDLIDYRHFRLDGNGYNQLPCIGIATSSPEKILETIKKHFQAPSIAMRSSS